jgi:tetratricopeptide (TPR) repeat protein
MGRLESTLAAATFVWLIGLSPAGEPVFGREVKLVVRPQKVSAEAGKYALLPPAASLTDGDAVPLYEKAVKALPGKAVSDQIQQWLKMPIEQLPIDPVGEALEQYIGNFKCVAQAIKCRECQWPALTPGVPESGLQQYLNLGKALRLWARYEIAQENYDNAILALRTELGMSRHLMQGPTLIHYQIGNALAATLVTTEVAEFMRAGEAPNLYAALAALPKPFGDVEKAIENEKKGIPSKPPAGMTRAQFESALARSKASCDRVRIFAKGLEANLAALQCVEAIRSYAAAHGGQLPQTLAEITQVSVPKDPISGAAFRYTRIGTTAVLESAKPAGGGAEDVTRYEITVKN